MINLHCDWVTLLVLTWLFAIRGSYKGGPIDIEGGKGIKFED